jgi:hypothetical protein
MLLATSLGVYGIAVALFTVGYLLPFYVARRIGKPKGRAWFWYALFLHWIGVVILVLRTPKAWAGSTVGSQYHIPPEMARQRGRKTHWMYDQRRG